VRKTKSDVILGAHQNGGRPSTAIPEILDTGASIAEIRMSCHHEYSKAASVLQ
jgi:hypothetical protein